MSKRCCNKNLNAWKGIVLQKKNASGSRNFFSFEFWAFLVPKVSKQERFLTADILRNKTWNTGQINEVIFQHKIVHRQLTVKIK